MKILDMGAAHHALHDPPGTLVCPAGQGTQAAAGTHVPLEVDVPAGHTHPQKGDPAALTVPAAQGIHTDAPLLLYCPAGHI